jgi:hypothetical protein
MPATTRTPTTAMPISAHVTIEKRPRNARAASARIVSARIRARSARTGNPRIDVVARLLAMTRSA